MPSNWRKGHTHASVWRVTNTTMTAKTPLDSPGHLWRRSQGGRRWCRSGRWSSRCRRCTSTHRQGDDRKHAWRSATCRADTRRQYGARPAPHMSEVALFHSRLLFISLLYSWFHTPVSHLGFTGGAAGVEDEQRVLSIQPLRLTLFWRVAHRLIPPHITSWVPGGLNTPEEGPNETHETLISSTHSMRRKDRQQHTMSILKRLHSNLLRPLEAYSES